MVNRSSEEIVNEVDAAFGDGLLTLRYFGLSEDCVEGVRELLEESGRPYSVYAKSGSIKNGEQRYNIEITRR